MSILKVNPAKIIYKDNLVDGLAYTAKMDKYYDLLGKFYNVLMMLFPTWKRWISSVLPHICGNRILEVSFGTGYLLEKCSTQFECHGLDYNESMVNRAQKRLDRKNLKAQLIRGNVESLPYDNDYFDCVINTMAMSGYPDGDRALDEIMRVLKPTGKLLLVDFDYPKDRNILGFAMADIMARSGDRLKDIENLLKSRNLNYSQKTVGGFGSVFFYIITK